jgi:hypothetical protein
MQDDHLAQPSAAVRLRLEGPIFALVEDWRRSHEKIPSRSEALRLFRTCACRASGRAPTARAAATTHHPFAHHKELSEIRDGTPPIAGVRNQSPRGTCARAWLIKTSATLLLIQSRHKLQVLRAISTRRSCNMNFFQPFYRRHRCRPEARKAR